MDRAKDPELSTIHFFMTARDGRILDISREKVQHSSIRINSIPGAIFDCEAPMM
jgi:hypothetical protein